MDQFVSFTLLLIIASAMGSPTEDYSWRDFEGIVPPDALPVGIGKNGKLIFIGQVLIGGKLIPGRVRNFDKNIYFEHGEKAWAAGDNVKIFCTQHPENFRWVSTTHHEIRQLPNILIEGGFEPECTTYIGRVLYENGETNVGKVICNDGDCLALYVNNNGKYAQYHSFEILTYHPLSNYLQ